MLKTGNGALEPRKTRTRHGSNPASSAPSVGNHYEASGSSNSKAYGGRRTRKQRGSPKESPGQNDRKKSVGQPRGGLCWARPSWPSGTKKATRLWGPVAAKSLKQRSPNNTLQDLQSGRDRRLRKKQRVTAAMTLGVPLESNRMCNSQRKPLRWAQLEVKRRSDLDVRDAGTEAR